MTRHLILLAGLLALGFEPVRAQRDPKEKRGVILGTVTDTSLRPVSEAQAAIVLSNVHVTADVDGRFQITDIPGGSYLLVVRRLGFQPASSSVEVHAGDTLRLAFMLEPSSPELASVLITEKSKSVRLKEFDERRKKGDGEFFTQEEIEKRNVTQVYDLLRQTKGVRLKEMQGGRLEAHSARQFTQCPMQVYIDGIPYSGVRNVPLDLRTMLPSPKDLMGIEVYSGSASVPLWLPAGPPGAFRSCGAILLWTRDGS